MGKKEEKKQKQQEEQEVKKETNAWDVVIHLLNCLLNLLKVEKVMCLTGIYLLYRDYVLIGKLDENVDITKLMIDAEILNNILSNDNTLIIVLVSIIVILLVALLMMCFYVVPMHKKEIARLAEMRSSLMHEKNLENLKEHHSSMIV